MRRHFDWIVTCFLCLGQTDNRLRTSEVCVFNFSCSRLAITCDKYHAKNNPSVLTIVINYRFKLLLMCFYLPVQLLLFSVVWRVHKLQTNYSIRSTYSWRLGSCILFHERHFPVAEDSFEEGRYSLAWRPPPQFLVCSKIWDTKLRMQEWDFSCFILILRALFKWYSVLF